MAKSFYDILEIDSEASAEQIKKAYRKLAMDCHPDRHPDNALAEKLFREISSAYQILIDQDKRTVYDTYGADAFNTGDFQNPIDLFQEVFGASGVFEQFFGGKMTSHRPKKGEDIKCILEIELEETLTGCTRETTINRLLECNKCAGTGKTPQSTIIVCTVCRGTGKLNAATGMQISHNCPNCGGSGNVVKNPCGHCRGSGAARKDCQVSLTIPPGIAHNSRLRNIGGGDIGRSGGKPGNLYIQIEVVKHPVYTQKGKDIFGEISIPFGLAVFGGQVEITTLQRDLKTITIPIGAQGGDYLKIPGEGTVSLTDTKRGDLFLRLNIVVPKNLTPEQKNILEKALEKFE